MFEILDANAMREKVIDHQEQLLRAIQSLIIRKATIGKTRASIDCSKIMGVGRSNYRFVISYLEKAGYEVNWGFNQYLIITWDF